MRPIFLPLMAALLPGSLAFRKHHTHNTTSVEDAVSVTSAKGAWVVVAEKTTSVATTFSTLTKRAETDSTSTATDAASSSTTKTKKTKTKTKTTATDSATAAADDAATSSTTKTKKSKTKTKTKTATTGNNSTATAADDAETSSTTKTKKTKTKTTSVTASATAADDQVTPSAAVAVLAAQTTTSTTSADSDDDSTSTSKTKTKTKTTKTTSTTASATAGDDEETTSTTKTKSTKTTKTTATATSSAAVNAVTSASNATATTAGNATTAAAVTATAAAGSGVGATKITTVAGGSGVGGTTCTVTAFADVSASVAACSNILLSGITVPASSTLSVTVPTSGALLFAGTMTVEYTPDSEYTPIVLKGSYATVAGLAGAVIDGQGAQYWDGEGSNGGTDKPDHFIKLSDMVSSSFGEITIQNWPTHLFEITGCTDVTMTNMILDNSAGDATDSDGDALGHNTDAFDVSSTDGLYVSSATVYNQDDCVAVNSGSNMVFENLYCSGGHGLSIGSVDSGVTISNITFQDSSVIDSANGCRIKTDADGSDSTVSDITYSNIYLSNISKYGIDVQQDYENGSPTGDPTTGITVSGVTFSSISGTVSDSSAYEYYILCGSTSSCTDFTWTDVSITGGTSSCSPSGDICPSS